jgi:hypothetical protein
MQKYLPLGSNGKAHYEIHLEFFCVWPTVVFFLTTLKTMDCCIEKENLYYEQGCPQKIHQKATNMEKCLNTLVNRNVKIKASSGHGLVFIRLGKSRQLLGAG